MFRGRYILILYQSVYFIASLLLIYWLRPPYLFSILVVLLPPSLANFLWLKRSRHKILLFSVLTTLLFAPAVELAARLANVWDVQSVLPRPFGLIPIENMLFAFFNFFWVLSFYENFIDRDTSATLSSRFKYLIGIYCLASFVVFGIYLYDSELVALSYFSIALPVLVIPALVFLISNPRLLRKTVIPTIFFAAVFFAYELVSLNLGSWWWPGKYIFPILVFGHIFPIDDVVFWYFLSTPVLICGYEFFADDFR